MAPLLPKLRGYFAEFLRESYLAHLGILYRPTCGGLRYGYGTTWLAKLFLAVWRLCLRGRSPFPSRLTFSALADLPTRTRYTLGPAHPVAGAHSLLRPSAAPNGYTVVQEYQPDVHRLRLSASP